MLKSIGVDSIKELSHRNPTHLKEMIETRHGRVVGLSEHACQTWVDEAKAFVTSPTSPGAGLESDRE
jgi:hypothetical protein